MPHPEQLSRTYGHCLRALGRYVDQNGLHMVGLYEVAGGFLLRGLSGSGPEAVEAIEVSDDELRNLMGQNLQERGKRRESIRTSLCPTGYEDFFRSVGDTLDADRASAVVVQELHDQFAVAYLQLHESSQGYVWVTKSFHVDPSGVETLIDKGFRRRRTR